MTFEEILNLGMRQHLQRELQKSWSDHRSTNDTIPCNAIRIKGVNVGDIVYCSYGGFDPHVDGIISRAVVLYVDDDGHIITAELGAKNQSQPRWECDNVFRTLEEAVQCSIDNDLEYHKPRVDFAESMQKKLDAGQDVSFVLAPDWQPDFNDEE